MTATSTTYTLPPEILDGLKRTAQFLYESHDGSESADDAFQSVLAAVQEHDRCWWPCGHPEAERMDKAQMACALMKAHYIIQRGGFADYAVCRQIADAIRLYDPEWPNE